MQKLPPVESVTDSSFLQTTRANILKTKTSVLPTWTLDTMGARHHQASLSMDILSKTAPTGRNMHLYNYLWDQKIG